MNESVRLRNRALAFISILNLIVPAGLLADNTTITKSTATVPSTARHHHKHKKKPADTAATKASVTAAGADATQSGTAFSATKQDPGALNPLEGNNAGGQNMMTGDHTPGTTGTSGQ